MIQDIFPQVFDSKYVNKEISLRSVVFVFSEDKVLCCNEHGKLRFPKYEDISAKTSGYTYLFAIDDTDFFLASQEEAENFGEYSYERVNIFRTTQPGRLVFAMLTAYHLYQWYGDNKFCGKCGGLLAHNALERELICKECDHIVFPKISPAIIVGVTDGDKLLLTKYSNREYKRYALIAGYVEIGESAEEAVRREVFEEVGVRVKDICYYKSQPWGFSGSLLLGYFASLDGDSNLKIDESELSEATWVKRCDIPADGNVLSLTNEMIQRFREQGCAWEQGRA